jgi:glycerate dehydrogenase
MTPREIVVLDGHPLNSGDLNWDDIRALGNATFHDRTAPADIVARASSAEIVLTNKTPLSAAAQAQLPNLRYIGVMATGCNVVDLVAARERGIIVTNVPEYGTDAVAQHTWALLLELTQHVGRHSDSVREGNWTSKGIWCYWETSPIELSGLRLGLVGSGRIGNAVGRIGAAFGMTVGWARRSGGLAELEAVFRESDVVSLHCPLTPETRGIIRAETLAWMKPTALLLNTSRGLLIDEADLAAALNNGRIAGAAVDVLSVEPPPADNPLLTARNCLITPHMAWAARATRARLLRVVADNVRAYLKGSPVNVVN